MDIPAKNNYLIEIKDMIAYVSSIAADILLAFILMTFCAGIKGTGYF